jgi:DNA mismatch repair protein MutL
VIGQAHETYILAEGPGGVYLIDQHAAHERVLYEDIRRRVASRSAESQPLLEPEPVDLAPAHAAVIEEQAATLSAAGFVIEPFGPKTALLRAVPKLLADRGQGRAGDWLIKLLDDAAERGRTDSWQDRLLYTLACHAAVRAGRKMTLDESRELIRQLEQAETPHTCPHGRPTMVHLTSGQLEREFGRR